MISQSVANMSASIGRLVQCKMLDIVVMEDNNFILAINCNRHILS